MKLEHDLELARKRVLELELALERATVNELERARTRKRIDELVCYPLAVHYAWHPHSTVIGHGGYVGGASCRRKHRHSNPVNLGRRKHG